MTFKQYLYVVWSEPRSLSTPGVRSLLDTRPDCAATVLFDPNVESVTPWSYAPAYMGLMESPMTPPPRVSLAPVASRTASPCECAEACHGFASGAEPEPSEACTQCMVVRTRLRHVATPRYAPGLRYRRDARLRGDSCDIPDGCAGVAPAVRARSAVASASQFVEMVRVDGEDLGCPWTRTCIPLLYLHRWRGLLRQRLRDERLWLESTCCLDNDEAATSWSDGVCLEVAQQACQWLCQPETCGDGLCDCDAQENGTTCPADCADDR